MAFVGNRGISHSRLLSIPASCELMGSDGQTNADGTIMKQAVDEVFRNLLVKCFREEESEVVERVVGYVREMRRVMWDTPSTASP